MGNSNFISRSGLRGSKSRSHSRSDLQINTAAARENSLSDSMVDITAYAEQVANQSTSSRKAGKVGARKALDNREREMMQRERRRHWLELQRSVLELERQEARKNSARGRAQSEIIQRTRTRAGSEIDPVSDCDENRKAIISRARSVSCHCSKCGLKYSSQRAATSNSEWNIVNEANKGKIQDTTSVTRRYAPLRSAPIRSTKCKPEISLTDSKKAAVQDIQIIRESGPLFPVKKSSKLPAVIEEHDHRDKPQDFSILKKHGKGSNQSVGEQKDKIPKWSRNIFAVGGGLSRH